MSLVADATINDSNIAMANHIFQLGMDYDSPFGAATNRLSKADIRVVSAVGPFEVYGEASEFFADQSYLFVREQRRLRRKHGA